MKLISALASVSVLTFACAAFAQDQPAPAPAQPATPAAPAQAPAPEATPAAAPSDMSADKPAAAASTYGKGWNAKKCAAAKAKNKTIPDGACPSDMAPK